MFYFVFIIAKRQISSRAMKLQYVLFLAKKVLLIKKRKNICIYDIINIILVILKIYNKNGGGAEKMLHQIGKNQKKCFQIVAPDEKRTFYIWKRMVSILNLLF